jgi:peptidoglycan/LPS O-acetylase OafA/YrhL
MASQLLKDYRALDAYRFLAAVMVAVGHFNDGFKLGLEHWTPISLRFGLFVDFFFILSGFVIALTYSNRIHDLRTCGDFLWRRVARLWPLHLAVLIIFAAIGLVGHLSGYHFNNPETLNPSGLPWNLVLMHAWGPVWHQSFNVASWSISAEMFVYALFPLFAWQVRRWPVVLNVAIIAGFVALMTAARDAAGLRPWYQATYDLGALRAVPSFLLGVIVHRIVTQTRLPFTVTWPMAHAVFATALLGMHIGAPSELIIALFGVFVLAAAKAEEANPATWLSGDTCQRFGQASYALYMVHMPMMTCGMVIARRTTGLGGWSGWLFASIILLAATAIALWLYRNFEDPWRKRINAMSPFREQVRRTAV